MSLNNNQIKEELFSLFKGIKDDIPNDKLPLNRKNIQNISTLDSITLITYIKESIPILINQKISEAKTQNNNDITQDTKEFDDYLNLKKEYNQLENQLKKVENDYRYYLQKYLKKKLFFLTSLVSRVRIIKKRGFSLKGRWLVRSTNKKEDFFK